MIRGYTQSTDKSMKRRTCLELREKSYFITYERATANNIESIFAEQRKILDVKKHPDYDSDNKAFYFDIAIITVSEELQFSPRISPICLPDSFSLYPGTGISVQGWGKTDRGGGKDVSQANVNIRSKESLSLEKLTLIFRFPKKKRVKLSPNARCNLSKGFSGRWNAFLNSKGLKSPLA